MALNCYVGQNIIALVIFYGWGLGLSGNVGALLTLLVALCAVLMLLTCG